MSGYILGDVRLDQEDPAGATRSIAYRCLTKYRTDIAGFACVNTKKNYCLYCFTDKSENLNCNFAQVPAASLGRKPGILELLFTSTD